MTEEINEAARSHSADVPLVHCTSQPLKVPGPEFARGVAPQLRDNVFSRALAREPVLGYGQLSEYLHPFRHYGATNVLDTKTYEQLSRQFSLILDATAVEHESEFKLKKIRSNYDALILGLNPKLAVAFSPLFSEDWLRPLANFLGLKFLPRIEGALHSNPKGSSTGWIHTDLCSGWFDESGSTADELMLPPRGRCNYFNGRPLVAYAKPKEYVRAATIIFYLCNDGWSMGDGGETGLYSAARESRHTDVRLVQPVNNSLLLFECSPHSYHRFVSNPGRTRNSIILWLHTSVEDADAKWGSAINRPVAR